MYNDNGSSVTSLAAPVRTDQYSGICAISLRKASVSRAISYSTRKHIGMGMAILPETKRLDAHR